MKTIRTMFLTVALVTLASAAFAAGTATLTINANVLPTCRFVAAGTTMTFAAIDPTSITDVTAQATIDFNCSSGVAYSFTNPTTANIAFGVIDSMTVDLLYTDGSPVPGTGSGVDETLTIDGTITALNFANKPAGAYTGTATLTVNP